MIHPILESIDRDIALLQSVRSAIEALPNLDTIELQSCGGRSRPLFEPDLMQLWPGTDSEHHPQLPEGIQPSALAFAKQLGDCWERSPDGSWRGVLKLERDVKIIIHNAEQAKEAASLANLLAET